MKNIIVPSQRGLQAGAQLSQAKAFTTLRRTRALAKHKRPNYNAKRLFGIVLLLLSLVIALLGYVAVHGTVFSIKYLAADYYANLSSGFLAIAITVLIIEYLNERRAAADQFYQLVREMGSGDNAFAAKAVKELRARGSLTDGSLVGSDFSAANLTNTDLTDGEFTEAVFVATNFTRIAASNSCFLSAKMAGAIMEGANLQGVDFSNADLHLADFSKANVKDARFHGANLAGANFEGSNITAEQLKSAHGVEAIELPSELS